jgi:hypothetical protein
MIANFGGFCMTLKPKSIVALFVFMLLGLSRNSLAQSDRATITGMV